MVLSIGTDGDADYYLGHQADYYTGGSEPVGRWYTPDGQFGLVNGEQIDNDIFRKLMEGIDPTNPDPATNVIGRPPKDPRKKRVSSYDLTFSVPKSVSVLWAIGDSQMRGRIERLVDDAVRRTLQTAQDHTAFIRRGRNGTDIQKTRLFGAIFQHGDARPMDNGKGEILSDMNLHHHCVMMNLGQDDRGEWYAIHAKVIMDWKMALGATHHAELARMLEDNLGCRVRTVGRNGEFEVVGVPDDVLARFSRRRALITESLKAYGLSSAEAPELAAAITRMSREAKPDVEHAERAQARFDRWASEALELGFTAAEVLACFEHPFTEEEERTRDLAFDERLQTLAKDITETEAVLDLGDVHRAVAALCAEHGRGADAVERAVAALIDPTPLPADLLSWDDARFDAFIKEKIAAGTLVTLPAPLADKAGRSLFTAPDLIQAERGIWQACDRHRDDERHVIPTHVVEAFLKDLHRKAAEPPPPGERAPLAPTEEQEYALRYATTCSGLVRSLEGAAGSGKSVTLKQITALYRDILGPSLGVDYRVIGCSAKWLTAKAMIEDADLADEDARAAAKWIADIRLGKETITERTVLHVDEAGQMGDRDLYNLLKPFTDAGAKVILTGDRAQQRSVGAGPALDIVAAAVGSFRLERTQRMRPQADDILVHRDGISREEAIILTHGLSKEQQSILVKGAVHVLRDEIRARFRDPHYTLSPEDVLIWGEGLTPMQAVKKAATLRDNQKALASLVRGHLSEDARENALAWAADPDAASSATPAMVHHYLHGQPWRVAEKRASLLTPYQSDALMHGHDRSVRAAVLKLAEDTSSPITRADELRWIEGLDRRTAEARSVAEAPATQTNGPASSDTPAQTDLPSPPPSPPPRGEGAPDRAAVVSSAPRAEETLATAPTAEDAATPLPPFLPPDRAAAVKRAMRAWAKRPDSARATAEDVLHHVFGLSWTDAIKRVDGMTPEQRTALLSSPFDRDYNAAEAAAIAAADGWATMPKETITTADVLVHVYGLTRPAAEARAAAMTPQQRQKMVDLEYHHTAVRDAGQIWSRQTATDMSYAPDSPDGAMKALQAYAAHDNLVWKETPEDALIAAVEAWKAYMASNPKADDILSNPTTSRQFAVVIAKSNEAVRAQNTLMRNHLRERGLLGPTDTIVKTQSRQRIGNRHLEVDLPIAIGEQILFTERDQTLDVVNGTIGCVTHIAPSTREGHAVLTVQLGSGDGRRTITFDTADYADDTSGRANLEHSYAVTTFSVQGMTTAAAFAQVDSSQKANSVYVAMSRGKGLTKLFASTQTENNFLAAELPLSQKLRASFGERDRLRSLSRFIARGQKQSAIFDAFDPNWQDKIQTIRPEDHFRHKDIELLALSDEDLAAAIDDMVNAPAAPLPEDPDAPTFDPDALDAPSREWLDHYDLPAAPPSPPPLPHLDLPLVQAKPSRPTGSSSSPSPLFASPAPTQTIFPLPTSASNPSRSDAQRAPAARPPSLPTSLHDTPIRLSTLPLILQRVWTPPDPVTLTALPTILAAQPSATSPTANLTDAISTSLAPETTSPVVPPSNVPNWQPRREPLNSPQTPVPVRASTTRVARHLLATRTTPHLRPGGTMPRDDNTAIAPRNRRNFRSYTPANGVAQRERDPRIGEEMTEIMAGGVDFRDVLEKAGWKAVSTNDPAKWCFWTNGSTTNLDAENTVSIKLFKDGWGWKTKDGTFGGNMITWGREFEGWPPKGDKKGYVETWKLLREFLPGVTPLDQTTPLTPEQQEASARAKQEAAERRDALRLANEEARRQSIAETHARAAEYWPKLSTPAATPVGNILDRRGITRATQNAYADTIRFGSNHLGPFVAFKHVAADGTITGAERKGDGWNLFTEGSGGKALALFGNPNATLSRIVIVETGVDAVSRAQLDGCPADVLYVSTGGNSSMKLNEEWGSHFAAEHIVALAHRHPGAVIDLATDRDNGGNSQATGWATLLAGHPGGIERSTPSLTNDWNNELRAPSPALLKVDAYRKDLRKASPSLPPPPAARPDLLPHWQAYEAARPILPSVLEAIARNVGAWDEAAGAIDRHRWRDAPLARTLWDAIHDSISPDTPLPVAIDGAVNDILPRWHAWHAQVAAFKRLSETFRQTLAGDPETGRIDQKRLKQSGAPAYLKEIQDAILTQSQSNPLPLSRAISAAIASIDAQDGEAIKASRNGRADPPPDRTAARDALLRMRAHIEAHPDDFAIPPASPSLYPALAHLQALSQQLAATASKLPDPATWTPTDPPHDPVAEARAAANAKATPQTSSNTSSATPGAEGAAAAPATAQDDNSTPTTEAAESARPFADPANKSATTSPSPAASSAPQSPPSPSSPASSDQTFDPTALPAALAAVHAARQAWTLADQRAPAGEHITESSAEQQAQIAARRAGHTDAEIGAAALGIPLPAYDTAAGLPTRDGRPGLLLPATESATAGNELVALQQAILSQRATNLSAAFADDRSAAQYEMDGAQRMVNAAHAKAHLAGISEATIRTAIDAITHPRLHRQPEPMDPATLATAGTTDPTNESTLAAAADPAMDDDARHVPPLDDEDRPPTEDEIAADIALRAASASAASPAQSALDLDPDTDLDSTHANEDDAIMDTLTPPPPSAADILAAEQQEAATRAAELQAVNEQANRARQESADRRLRAEDRRNRMEGISSDTTARPPKPNGQGKETALGEDFGVDNSSEKQRHAFLKELGEYYKTHFAAKHEQEIAHVRIRPGQHVDEVVVEFRDGSKIRDDGRSIMLDSKGSPQKAELLIEIAAARGMSPLRLKGSREFKQDLAKACYEAGIEVLNPELADFMRMLAERFPERAGINKRESNFEDPHAATNQSPAPDTPPPSADPAPTDPIGPTPTPSATNAADPAADPLAQRLIDLTTARVARADAALTALSASLDQSAVDTATAALADARAALDQAQQLAAIRAGTLTNPTISLALAEDDALRLWITDEVARATRRTVTDQPQDALSVELLSVARERARLHAELVRSLPPGRVMLAEHSVEAAEAVAAMRANQTVPEHAEGLVTSADLSDEAVRNRIADHKAQIARYRDALTITQRPADAHPSPADPNDVLANRLLSLTADRDTHAQLGIREALASGTPAALIDAIRIALPARTAHDHATDVAAARAGQSTTLAVDAYSDTAVSHLIVEQESLIAQPTSATPSGAEGTADRAAVPSSEQSEEEAQATAPAADDATSIPTSKSDIADQRAAVLLALTGRRVELAQQAVANGTTTNADLDDALQARREVLAAAFPALDIQAGNETASITDLLVRELHRAAPDLAGVDDQTLVEACDRMADIDAPDLLDRITESARSAVTSAPYFVEDRSTPTLNLPTATTLANQFSAATEALSDAANHGLVLTPSERAAYLESAITTGRRLAAHLDAVRNADPALDTALGYIEHRQTDARILRDTFENLTLSNLYTNLSAAFAALQDSIIEDGLKAACDRLINDPSSFGDLQPNALDTVDLQRVVWDIRHIDEVGRDIDQMKDDLRQTIKGAPDDVAKSLAIDIHDLLHDAPRLADLQRDLDALRNAPTQHPPASAPPDHKDRDADIRDAIAEDQAAAIEAGRLPSEIGISEAARAELDYFLYTEGDAHEDDPMDRDADIREAAADDQAAAIEAGRLPSEIGIPTAGRAEGPANEQNVVPGSAPAPLPTNHTDPASPDPIADIHTALATLANDGAPEVVRAHAAMCAADARATLEAALSTAQAEAAANPSQSQLDTTLLDAFDTVQLGRQWLSMTASRYGNDPAALTSAMRTNPRGVINGAADKETVAYLSRLADAIDTTPSAQAFIRTGTDQPASANPTDVARTERIAELSAAISAAPSVDALHVAELKHLLNVDMDYGIHEAPTSSYAARVTPMVAARQASIMLDWTIDARLPGYRDAGPTRQMMLTNGLPFLDAKDRADIKAAAETAIRANHALQASASTPVHLRQGVEGRIAAADTVASAIVIASAPLPPPADPTAAAIFAASRILLTSPTPAQRAVSAAQLLSLVVDSAPTVSTLESSLLTPLAAAEKAEHDAASDLKFRRAELNDHVKALYADPRTVMAALDAIPPNARTTIFASEVNLQALGQFRSLDPTVHHADHYAAQFERARTLLPTLLTSWAAASSIHAASAQSLDQARTTVANTPNAPAAQEIRSAIRDAIPWSILPPTPGTDAADIRNAVCGHTTNLDAAAAILYHTASPATHALTAADLSQDNTLSAADRETLATWLHLHDTLSKAADAQQAAQSPTASPADHLHALNAAENAILEVTIAAQQLGATTTNRAFHLAVDDTQATAHDLARQAATVIQSDPASLQHALAHGAEHALNTHLAQIHSQQDPAAQKHQQSQDYEPEMA